MTKKDYIKFAEMFAGQWEQLCPELATAKGKDLMIACGKGKQWKETIEKTADLFQRDNPRFDRERFLKACGLVN